MLFISIVSDEQPAGFTNVLIGKKKKFHSSKVLVHLEWNYFTHIYYFTVAKGQDLVSCALLVQFQPVQCCMNNYAPSGTRKVNASHGRATRDKV